MKIQKFGDFDLIVPENDIEKLIESNYLKMAYKLNPNILDLCDVDQAKLKLMVKDNEVAIAVLHISNKIIIEEKINEG